MNNEKKKKKTLKQLYNFFWGLLDYDQATLFQYVVFAHWMLCCPVGYVERGGGLTSRDMLNSSENYLLLGFLLAMPSQTVLLLVR